MDFQTFNEVIKKVKTKKPSLFELEHDNIPEMENIINFQKQHKIILPEKYIQFLLSFGGEIGRASCRARVLAGV